MDDQITKYTTAEKVAEIINNSGKDANRIAARWTYLRCDGYNTTYEEIIARDGVSHSFEDLEDFGARFSGLEADRIFDEIHKNESKRSMFRKYDNWPTGY